LKNILPALTKIWRTFGSVFFGVGPTKIAVDFHVAPAEHVHAVGLRRVFDHLSHWARVDRVLREEDHPHAVLPQRREGESELFALATEERIGACDHDARAVAGVGFAPAAAAMVHIVELWSASVTIWCEGWPLIGR